MRQILKIRKMTRTSTTSRRVCSNIYKRALGMLPDADAQRLRPRNSNTI